MWAEKNSEGGIQREMKRKGEEGKNIFIFIFLFLSSFFQILFSENVIYSSKIGCWLLSTSKY